MFSICFFPFDHILSSSISSLLVKFLIYSLFDLIFFVIIVSNINDEYAIHKLHFSLGFDDVFSTETGLELVGIVGPVR